MGRALTCHADPRAWLERSPVEQPRAAPSRRSGGALCGGCCPVGATYRFPEWWATVRYSVAGSVTFLMVFVIQHTQARQTAATQLKLDELIRASARADDGLIAVEEAPAAHLQALTDLTLAERDWK